MARLARLDLTEEEIDRFSHELTEILHYVEQLDSVDTTGIEPTTQVTGLKNVMREDIVTDYGVAPADLLKLAPRTEDGHIKVERMIG